MTDRPTATIKTGDLRVKYSHVSKPDTKFNAEGEYKITVEFDEELATQLEKLATDWDVDQPFVRERNGEKTITFKSKYKPKMFTAEDITARTPGFCWSGDTVNINSVCYPVEVMGKTYLSMKFNAVLLKEVNGEQREVSNPFGTGSVVTQSSSTEGEQPDTPTVINDEIPFSE
tara:strand:- start:1962 stop:2480 length:519 start_codon:yes stop_codon:yes gene_type:complete